MCVILKISKPNIRYISDQIYDIYHIKYTIYIRSNKRYISDQISSELKRVLGFDFKPMYYE